MKFQTRRVVHGKAQLLTIDNPVP